MSQNRTCSGGKGSSYAEMVAEKVLQQSVAGRDLVDRSPGDSTGEAGRGGGRGLEIGNTNAFEEMKGKLEGVGTSRFLVLFLLCLSGQGRV